MTEIAEEMLVGVGLGARAFRDTWETRVDAGYEIDDDTVEDIELFEYNSSGEIGMKRVSLYVNKETLT